MTFTFIIGLTALLPYMGAASDAQAEQAAVVLEAPEGHINYQWRKDGKNLSPSKEASSQPNQWRIKQNDDACVGVYTCTSCGSDVDFEQPETTYFYVKSPKSAVMSLRLLATSTHTVPIHETATVRFFLGNASAEAVSGTMEVYYTDLWGNSMASPQSQEVTLNGETTRLFAVSSAFEKVGYVGLRLLFRDSSGEVLIQQSPFYSHAVLPEEATFEQDSRFLTYMIGNTGMLADIVPKGFYTDMAEMGARWGTMDVWWSLMEPTEGTYNWAYYDSYLQKMLEVGITPIPHLFAIPKWLSSNPSSSEYWQYPPTDWTEWEGFVEDFVERYGSWLTYLRIWNEPNIGYWKGTPAQYAQLVIHASQAAKRVKPDIKIIIEAVADKSCDVIPFFNAVDAAGATPYWDILGVHNYWMNNANYPERTNYLPTYSAVLAWRDAHKPGAPVWDTEFACMAVDWSGGFWVGVGERKQAQWLARGYVLGFSLGLQKMCWFPGYSWPDPEETGGTAPYYNPAGLLRVDLSPRPAYSVYHTLAKTLNGCTYDAAIALGEDQYARGFSGGEGRYITALWSVDAAHAGKVKLHFTRGEAVAITNLMGVETTEYTDLSDGSLEVDISEDMVLIASSERPSIEPLPAAPLPVKAAAESILLSQLVLLGGFTLHRGGHWNGWRIWKTGFSR